MQEFCPRCLGVGTARVKKGKKEIKTTNRESGHKQQSGHEIKMLVDLSIARASLQRPSKVPGLGLRLMTSHNAANFQRLVYLNI